MNLLRFVFCIALLISFQFSWAEYRVYRLKITRTPAGTTPPSTETTPAPDAQSNPEVVPVAPSASTTEAKTPPAQTETFPEAGTQPADMKPVGVRTIESTLDPQQYSGYYPLHADEKIELVTTWRCFGRTENFQSFCPNPKEQNLTLQKPSDSPVQNP